MGFKISIVVVTATVLVVQANRAAPGVLISTDSTKLPSQSTQEGYPTKEIILYLTPSQIRALQNGQGLINPPPITNVGGVRYPQSLTQSLPAHQDQDYLHPNFAHPSPTGYPPIEKLQQENYNSASQNLNNSTITPSLSTQKKYATKEVILYLTPSQIKALQEGQGLINPPHVAHDNSDKHTQAYIQEQTTSHPHQNDDQRPQLAYELPLTTRKEPHSDQFYPIIAPPAYPENYAYLNFKSQTQPRFSKPIPFFPEISGESVSEHKELPARTSKEPVHKKEQDSLVRDQLKEQLFRLLDQNRAHFKTLAALSQYQSVKAQENKNNLSQYGPTFSDPKHVLAVENLINNNQQHQIQNQQAVLQAQATANSPPFNIHKEINIKHSPGHFNKHIPVTILMPVPRPEVKIPLPYPVPLRIDKAHVPIVKDKHLHVTKNFYTGRPYFGDRIIPLETHDHGKEKISTHNHEWHHL